MAMDTDVVLVAAGRDGTHEEHVRASSAVLEAASSGLRWVCGSMMATSSSSEKMRFRSSWDMIGLLKKRGHSKKTMEAQYRLRASLTSHWDCESASVTRPRNSGKARPAIADGWPCEMSPRFGFGIMTDDVSRSRISVKAIRMNGRTRLISTVIFSICKRPPRGFGGLIQ